MNRVEWAWIEGIEIKIKNLIHEEGQRVRVWNKMNNNFYWHSPFPSHLPLAPPARTHFTLGLLNLEGPQNRLVAVPRHRGTL